MFEYVNQKQCCELRTKCEEILHDVQNMVSDYFTFQYYLIGSGDRKLVTKNDNDEFDLDYNLILMKDFKGLINNPKQIKEIFLSAFNKANRDLDFSFAKNSKSVITSKLIYRNVQFHFDCAIMCEGNNGNMYKIVFDKPDNYLWNEIKHTQDFNARYTFLKSKGEFVNIKKMYLEKKNYYAKKDPNRSSFSILSEVVNNLIQKYL